MQGNERLSIGDRGADLQPVAHDRGVGHEALVVVFFEARDHGRVEVGERCAETIALAQDRDPGKAGLEGLERESLEEFAFVGAVGEINGPFVIVISLVGGVTVAEATSGGKRWCHALTVRPPSDVAHPTRAGLWITRSHKSR